MDTENKCLKLTDCENDVSFATLLIQQKANIEEINFEGYTPLMVAARDGHEKMVAFLLSQGANINALTKRTQETALTLACNSGFSELAGMLVKYGADMELGAYTPLINAALEGHLLITKCLLRAGANVHAQGTGGVTALTCACENGHTDIAELLLAYNAHLEHECAGGRTPLMKACLAGHFPTVQFLISKGANVNCQTTNNDHTPLSIACARGHSAIVELLLSNQANSFHRLKDNFSMLMHAAKGGHTNVAKLLFNHSNNILSTHAFQPNAEASMMSTSLNNNTNITVATQPSIEDTQRSMSVTTVGAPTSDEHSCQDQHEVPKTDGIISQTKATALCSSTAQFLKQQEHSGHNPRILAIPIITHIPEPPSQAKSLSKKGQQKQFVLKNDATVDLVNSLPDQDSCDFHIAYVVTAEQEKLQMTSTDQETTNLEDQFSSLNHDEASSATPEASIQVDTNQTHVSRVDNSPVPTPPPLQVEDNTGTSLKIQCELYPDVVNDKEQLQDPSYQAGFLAALKFYQQTQMSKTLTQSEGENEARTTQVLNAVKSQIGETDTNASK